MESFAHVSVVWNELTVDKPKVVFAVISVDGGSSLANTFEIDSFPALVFLPEEHLISKVINYRIKLLLVFTRREI